MLCHCVPHPVVSPEQQQVSIVTATGGVVMFCAMVLTQFPAVCVGGKCQRFWTTLWLSDIKQEQILEKEQIDDYVF